MINFGQIIFTIAYFVCIKESRSNVLRIYNDGQSDLCSNSNAVSIFPPLNSKNIDEDLISTVDEISEATNKSAVENILKRPTTFAWQSNEINNKNIPKIDNLNMSLEKLYNIIDASIYNNEVLASRKNIVDNSQHLGNILYNFTGEKLNGKSVKDDVYEITTSTGSLRKNQNKMLKVIKKDVFNKTENNALKPEVAIYLSNNKLKYKRKERSSGENGAILKKNFQDNNNEQNDGPPNKIKRNIIIIDGDTLTYNISLNELLNKYLANKNNNGSTSEYQMVPLNDNKNEEYFVDKNSRLDMNNDLDKPQFYVVFLTTTHPSISSKYIKKVNNSVCNKKIQQYYYKPIPIDYDKGLNLFMTTEPSQGNELQGKYQTLMKLPNEDNFNMFLKDNKAEDKKSSQVIKKSSQLNDNADENFNLFSTKKNTFITSGPFSPRNYKDKFGLEELHHFRNEFTNHINNFEDIHPNLLFTTVDSREQNFIHHKEQKLEQNSYPQFLFLSNHNSDSAKKSIDYIDNSLTSPETNVTESSQQIIPNQYDYTNKIDELMRVIEKDKGVKQKLDFQDMNIFNLNDSKDQISMITESSFNQYSQVSSHDTPPIRNSSDWKIILIRQNNNREINDATTNVLPLSELHYYLPGFEIYNNNYTDGIKNITHNVGKEKLFQMGKDKQFIDNCYQFLTGLRPPDDSISLPPRFSNTKMLQKTPIETNICRYIGEQDDTSDSIKSKKVNKTNKDNGTEKLIMNESNYKEFRNISEIQNRKIKPLSAIIKELEEALESPENKIYTEDEESHKPIKSNTFFDRDISLTGDKENKERSYANYNYSLKENKTNKNTADILNVETLKQDMSLEQKYCNWTEKQKNILNSNCSKIISLNNNDNLLNDIVNSQSNLHILYIIPEIDNSSKFQSVSTLGKIPINILEKLIELKDTNLRKKIRRSNKDSTDENLNNPTYDQDNQTKLRSLAPEVDSNTEQILTREHLHNKSDKLGPVTRKIKLPLFLDNLFNNKKYYLSQGKVKCIDTSKSFKNISNTGELKLGYDEGNTAFQREISRTKRMVSSKKKPINSCPSRSTDSNSTDSEDEYNSKFQALQTDLQELQSSILSQLKSGTKNDDKNLTLQIRVVVDVLNNTPSFDSSDDTQLKKRQAKSAKEITDDAYQELKNIIPMILGHDSALNKETRGNGGIMKKQADSFDNKHQNEVNNNYGKNIRESLTHLNNSENMYVTNNSVIKNITYLLDSLIENVRSKRTLFRTENKSKNNNKSWVSLHKSPEYFIFYTFKPVNLAEISDDELSKLNMQTTEKIEEPCYRGKKLHDLIYLSETTLDDDINLSINDNISKGVREILTSESYENMALYATKQKLEKPLEAQKEEDYTSSYELNQMNLSDLKPKGVFDSKYLSKREASLTNKSPIQKERIKMSNKYYKKEKNVADLKRITKLKSPTFWENISYEQAPKHESFDKGVSDWVVREKNRGDGISKVNYYSGSSHEDMHEKNYPPVQHSTDSFSWEETSNRSELFKIFSNLANMRNNGIGQDDLSWPTYRKKFHEAKPDTTIPNELKNYFIHKIIETTTENSRQENELNSTKLSTTQKVQNEIVSTYNPNIETTITGTTKIRRTTTKKHKGYQCRHFYKNHTNRLEHHYNPDKLKSINGTENSTENNKKDSNEKMNLSSDGQNIEFTKETTKCHWAEYTTKNCKHDIRSENIAYWKIIPQAPKDWKTIPENVNSKYLVVFGNKIRNKVTKHINTISNAIKDYLIPKKNNIGNN